MPQATVAARGSVSRSRPEPQDAAEGLVCAPALRSCCGSAAFARKLRPAKPTRAPLVAASPHWEIFGLDLARVLPGPARASSVKEFIGFPPILR